MKYIYILSVERKANPTSAMHDIIGYEFDKLKDAKNAKLSMSKSAQVISIEVISKEAKNG